MDVICPRCGRASTVELIGSGLVRAPIPSDCDARERDPDAPGVAGLYVCRYLDDEIRIWLGAAQP